MVDDSSQSVVGHELQGPVRWLYSLQVQLCLFGIASVLLPLIAISIALNSRVSEVLEDAIRHSNNERLRSVAGEIANELRLRCADTLQIVRYPPILGLHRAERNGGIDPVDQSTSEQWANRLEQLFTGYAVAHNDVRQIRYLDASGKEWVRVDSTGEAIRVVPEDSLQDKSHRDYFERAAQLESGEVFVSEISLNEEQGQVEKPLRPVLRFATPVRLDGTLIGVVVVNKSPELILERVSNLPGSQRFLASTDGTYLYHTDSSKCWGPQLGHEENAFSDWPDLGATTRQTEGFIESDHVILQWASISVPFADNQSRWILAVQQDHADYYLASSQIGSTILGVGLVAGLIFVLIAVTFAFIWTRPIGQLAQSADFIREGQLHVRASTRWHAWELKRLAKAFNRMADSVEVNTIYLEEKVQARTEELEKAKEGAEAAYRAKSTFLSTMSHELRTPLNAILGFCQVLERNTDLSASQLEKVGIMNRCGQHLLGLINQVLDVAKIESGRTEYREEVHELRMVLSDVEDMMRERAERRGLRFTFDAEANLPEFVYIDPIKVRQILINLIGNAIKFTSAGEVTIGIRHSEEPESKLHFSVRDSGPGIPPEKLDRLFTPFTQLQDYSAAQEGTGLGLTISREYARGMGGDIVAYNVPDGHGAIFEFVLPIRVCAWTEVRTFKDSQRRIVGVANDTSKYRVVVVDDNRENARVLEEMLKFVGVQTRSASNGKEALELLGDWQADVVLADIRMPVMNGFELVKRMREQGIDTPCIAITASIENLEPRSLKEADFFSVLPKPVDERKLYHLLSAVIPIKYVYEEEAGRPVREPLKPDELDAMIARLRATRGTDLDELEDALRELDLERIEAVIAALAAADPEAAELERLASEFRYEEMVRLVARGGDDEQ